MRKPGIKSGAPLKKCNQQIHRFKSDHRFHLSKEQVMKPKPRKLTLARETVLHLGTTSLKAVAGGSYPSFTDETYLHSCSGCPAPRTGVGNCDV